MFFEFRVNELNEAVCTCLGFIPWYNEVGVGLLAVAIKLTN